MPNRREPRKHGQEKKDNIVVCKARGLGIIILEIANKADLCDISGQPTIVRLHAQRTGARINCHLSLIENGVAHLKQQHRQTFAGA